MSYKLFIPGPVAVSEKTLRAMAQAMIGHRSSDFVALYKSIQPGPAGPLLHEGPGLPVHQQRLGHHGGAVRNVTGKKVLNCMNGAFSDKWHDVALRCGKRRHRAQVRMGPAGRSGGRAQGARHRRLRRRHPDPQRDLLRLHERPAGPDGGRSANSPTSSRSSTPSAPSARCRSRRTSSGSTSSSPARRRRSPCPRPLPPLRLPAGARPRRPVAGRGYYFDFVEFQKNHENGMTPSTPVIPLIYALKSKLEDIKAEGLEPATPGTPASTAPSASHPRQGL